MKILVANRSYKGHYLLSCAVEEARVGSEIIHQSDLLAFLVTLFSFILFAV